MVSESITRRSLAPGATFENDYSHKLFLSDRSGLESRIYTVFRIFAIEASRRSDLFSAGLARLFVCYSFSRERGSGVGASGRRKREGHQRMSVGLASSRRRAAGSQRAWS